MLTKTLFNIPSALRSLPLFQPNIIHRFCRITSFTEELRQLSRNFVKEENLSNESNTNEIPAKVLYLIKNNEQTISGPDIVTAMTSLLSLQKKQKFHKDLHKQEFFESLCTFVDTHIDKLQIFEAIAILKILVKLKVPSSSKIVSSILRHSDTLLSTTSLHDYNALAEIVLKMTPTPSTRAMYKSLNRKFILKLSTDFDINNLDFLANALQYTSYNINDRKILILIFDALQNFNFETAPFSSVVKIMKSLTFVKHYPSKWYPVLHQIQDILIKNVDKMTTSDINIILRGIVYKVHEERNEQFYNKTFVDNCAQKLVLDDMGLENGLSCLKSLNIIKHVHKELLSYISAKFYERRKIVHFSKDFHHELKNLLILVNGLAFLKYKPIFWEEIYKSLRTKELLKFDYETLLMYSLHLASLDCYDSLVLKKIFGTNTNLSKHDYIHWSLFKLWQKLKIIPNYNGPLPSAENIDSFKNLNIKQNSLLLSSLEHGVGGPMYIKTNLKSKLYHHIDYVIAFRKGGYPVAIRDVENDDTKDIKETVEYIEDLKVPLNCQIVAIVCILPFWYSRNTNQMLGPYSVYIETLEALSYLVVPISLKMWNQLPENSRTRFLMNEINSKLDIEK